MKMPIEEESNKVEIPENFIKQREEDIKEFLDSQNSFNGSYIWETFDSLFKTIYKQGKMLTQIEKRISDLENKMKNGNNSMS
jgi:hypothetical protein